MTPAIPTTAAPVPRGTHPVSDDPFLRAAIERSLVLPDEAAEIESYMKKDKGGSAATTAKPGSLGSIMGEDLRDALAGKGKKGKGGKKDRRESE